MKSYTNPLYIFISFLMLFLACSKNEVISEPTQEIGELELNFSTLEMNVGEKQRLAVLTDIGSAVISWSSGDSTKVSVNEYGRITALSGGAVSIIAHVGENSTTCHIKVNPDVYIAGHENEKPCYWKNEKKVQLSKNSGQALSIFVKGEDVYACGYEIIDRSRQAVLWKNGKATYLSDDVYYSRAVDLFIYENDIYVLATGAGVAYWKNYEKVIVNTDSQTSASSIYVSKEDVFIAGTTNEERRRGNAVYWKNTQEHKLDFANSGTRARAIAVENNNIHVLGRVTGFEDRSRYWKNGKLTPISNTALNKDMEPQDLFVTQNDVYILGLDFSDTSFLAKYWKNGIEIPLSDGSKSYFPQSIQVLDDDVYVTGVEGTHRFGGKPVYWKNGEITYLSDNYGAAAFSLHLN